MFARFLEIPSLPVENIKEKTKISQMDGWKDGCQDRRMDKVKQYTPHPTQFAEYHVTLEQIRKVFGDNSRIILLISP